MRDEKLNRLSKAELIELVEQLRSDCSRTYRLDVSIEVSACSEDEAETKVREILCKSDDVEDYDIRSIDCDC